jgi:hypothetical protein
MYPPSLVDVKPVAYVRPCYEAQSGGSRRLGKDPEVSCMLGNYVEVGLHGLPLTGRESGRR